MNINSSEALKKFGGSQDLLNKEIYTYIYQVVPWLLT